MSIFDYIDAPAKPPKEDNMSFSYAKKGVFNILGANGTMSFDCNLPFYSITSDDGVDKVQVDSDYSEEIVLMVAAMLSTLSDRGRDRAVKLANVLKPDPNLVVELNNIDDYIE